MAAKTTNAAAPKKAVRVLRNGELKYWVLQQGTEYFVVASAEEPDLTVPDGVRRKVIRGFTADDESAWARCETLAEQYHGTVRR